MSEIQAPTLKRIDRKTQQFTAKLDGVETVFFVQDHLSVDRYIRYLQLLPELTFGVTFRELYERMTEIHHHSTHGNDMINSMHQIATLSFNQLNSIIDFENRDIPKILEFCCLFINYANEDITIWDDRIVSQKIQAFRESGIDVSDFFFFASSAVQGFSKAYHKQTSETENEKSIVNMPPGMTSEHAVSIFTTSPDNS